MAKRKRSKVSKIKSFDMDPTLSSEPYVDIKSEIRFGCLSGQNTQKYNFIVNSKCVEFNSNIPVASSTIPLRNVGSTMCWLRARSRNWLAIIIVFLIMLYSVNLIVQGFIDAGIPLLVVFGLIFIILIRPKFQKLAIVIKSNNGDSIVMYYKTKGKSGSEYSKIIAVVNIINDLISKYD